MHEWLAARKPIEQRLTAARKQLAKVTRTTRRSTATSATAPGCAREWDALDLSQQHAIVAAVVDHVVVGPGASGLQPLRRVTADAGLAALSKQLRDLREREPGR